MRQTVDASIVQAPITQADAREREALNKGEAPEGWSKKRLAHTDRDARWTIKHGKAYYDAFAVLSQQGGKCGRTLTLARNALSTALPSWICAGIGWVQDGRGGFENSPLGSAFAQSLEGRVTAVLSLAEGLKPMPIRRTNGELSEEFFAKK